MGNARKEEPTVPTKQGRGCRQKEECAKNMELERICGYG